MAETNLRVWSALEKTNPKHTKPFKRAGGFSGTAVKPIYNDERMTETFGPCGVGWGIGKPEYTLVNSADGAIAVYCVAAIWFMDADKRSEPIYGVGGDFAVAKRQSGTFADDEAFKKAFTDAVGNAMKRLGMSADIHMGLFDDHKYVQERAREEAAEEREEAPRREPGPRPQAVQQQSAPAAEPPIEPWRKPSRPAEIPIPKSGGKPDWKDWAGMILHALSQAKDGAEASAWMRMNNPAMIALSSEAPKLWTRISDYARECGAEPNPLAA